MSASTCAFAVRACRRALISAALVALAIVLGCGTAILSSLLPVLEAAAVTPREGAAPASLERAESCATG